MSNNKLREKYQDVDKNLKDVNFEGFSMLYHTIIHLDTVGNKTFFWGKKNTLHSTFKLFTPNMLFLLFFSFQTFGEHFAQYQSLAPNQMGVEDFRSFLRLEQKVIFSERKSGQKM